MEGVITVQESRQNYDAMKNWRNEATKKIMSEKTINVIDTVLDVAKVTTMAVGTVATVVAAVSPAPVLSPVIAKASASLVGVIEGSKILLKGGNRDIGVNQITASLADFQGNIKDISIRDNNLVQSGQLQTNEQSNEEVNRTFTM